MVCGAQYSKSGVHIHALNLNGSCTKYDGYWHLKEVAEFTSKMILKIQQTVTSAFSIPPAQ